MKSSAVREKEAKTDQIPKDVVGWDRIDEGFAIIVKKMEMAKFRPRVIAGIQRGGLPLAVMLSHYYNCPFYLASRETQLVGKRMLLVDDVSDDGVTLHKYIKNLPKNTKTATLYYKSHSIFKPDFFAFKSDNWIVFPWEKEMLKKRKRLLGIL